MEEQNNQQQMQQQQVQQQEQQIQQQGRQMEQWTDVKGNNSGKATTAIIIVILLLVIAALGAFIFMKKDVLFSNKENNNEQTEKVSDEEKDDTEEVKEIDLSKSLNTTGIKYDNLNETSALPGISIKINDDKKSVTVTFDSEAQKMISTAIGTSSAQPTSNEIKGFSTNIISTYVGSLGQDVNSTILFFITEDKKIQYVKLFNNEQGSDGFLHLKTYWADGENNIKILNADNVDEIVKLYGASARAEFGYQTVLAAKADGSFYDLSQIIK